MRTDGAHGERRQQLLVAVRMKVRLGVDLRPREVVDALAQRDLVGWRVVVVAARVEVAHALGVRGALVARRRTLIRVVEDAAVARGEPGRS